MSAWATGRHLADKELEWRTFVHVAHRCWRRGRLLWRSTHRRAACEASLQMCTQAQLCGQSRPQTEGSVRWSREVVKHNRCLSGASRGRGRRGYQPGAPEPALELPSSCTPRDGCQPPWLDAREKFYVHLDGEVQARPPTRPEHIPLCIDVEYINTCIGTTILTSLPGPRKQPVWYENTKNTENSTEDG